MKNKNLILTLLIGSFLIYWLWPEEEPPPMVEVAEEEVLEEDDDEVIEEEEPPKPMPRPKARKKVLRQPIKTVKKIRAQAAPKQVAGKRKLPRGMVEFEIVGDNWAIAAGDIVLGKLTSEHKGKRGVFKPKKPGLWPSREIPYAISSQLDEPDRVREVIEYYNQETPIEFVPFNGKQKDYLVFVPFEDRCASYLGMVGGAQPIFLSAECGTTEIIHEVMHALGFVHEQSRKDRDQYVEVHWDKIQPEYHNQYDILPADLIHRYTGSVFNFDYNSIMLYGDNFFAVRSGDVTMTSKTSSNIAPVRGELSSIDIERLSYLYD